MSFDILIQMELTFNKIKILIYQSIIPSKAQQCGGQVNNNAFYVAFVGLAYQFKDIVYRFIIKYSNLIIIKKKTWGFKTWGVCSVGKEKVKGLVPMFVEHLKKKNPRLASSGCFLFCQEENWGCKAPGCLRRIRKKYPRTWDPKHFWKFGKSCQKLQRKNFHALKKA